MPESVTTTRAGVAIRDRHIEPHVTAGGRELDGVVEHDEEELAEQCGVAGDVRFLERPDLHRHALVLGQCTDRLDSTRGRVVEKQHVRA